jgi:hypothetical protein
MANFIYRLDAASMVLLEKLNKLEVTIAEQAAALTKISEVTAVLDPTLPNPNKGLLKSSFTPSKPADATSTTITRDPFSGEYFLVPKGRWASLDKFMSQHFVQNLLPSGVRYKSLVVDNNDQPRDYKLPNLQPAHTQRLLDRFLAEVHPLHPIIEVSTVDRIKKELNEDGLSWDGETAVVMHILAIGAMLEGEDPLGFNSAAKRRMGFAVERVGVMAIQAHYFQGYGF